MTSLASSQTPAGATVELLPFKSKRATPFDLNSTDRDIAGFQGYESSFLRQVVYYLLGLFSGGLLFLVAHWFLDVKLRLLLRVCPLHQAQYVVVTLVDRRRELVRVLRVPAFSGINVQATTHVLSEEEELDSSAAAAAAEAVGIRGGDGYDRLLDFRCGRYLYCATRDAFLPVPGLPADFASLLHRVATSKNLQGQVADEWERNDYRQLYGSNELVIPVKKIYELLVEEMVHPFYVFQYASITIWCLQLYLSYSMIILGITLFSILSTVFSTHAYRRRLAALAHYACEVKVVRGGRVSTVQSTELLPGDVIMVTPGVLPCDVVLVRGEAIVDENMLTGEAVPVRKVAYNPAVDGVQYNPEVQKGCTLYGGTTVAQVRGGGSERQTLGVVCRTAFGTAKGQLLKSILFPRQHKATFADDALKFIAVMLLLGLLFYIWDIIALATYGAGAGFIILKYLDLITIAVPPALPACLTVATTIAIGRLTRHDIFVSNPSAITMAGHLNVICFDKTGTLTEPGLALMGIVPAEGGAGGSQPGHPRFGGLVEAGRIPARFIELLATCHGLALLGEELVGDPLDQKLFQATGWSMLDDGGGQGVEVLTLSEDTEALPAFGSLEATPTAPPSPCVLATAHVCTRVLPPASWEGVERGDYKIVRRFEFSAEKQRNVVVVARPDGSLVAYAKGSPEIMRKLADPTTVPAGFEAELGKYTCEGLRVLGLAARELPGVSEAGVQGLSQEEVEVGLHFLGFSLLINALRPDTAAVIGELHDAGIRTLMVTGDHVRTGVSVAGQCGMLCQNLPVLVADTASSEGRVEDTQLRLAVLQPASGSSGGEGGGGEAAPLLGQVADGAMQAAVTGRGFEKLVEDPQAGGLDTLLHRSGVFARMSPDDKRLLVELLGEGAITASNAEIAGLGNFVGFCGDGANDVGALKAAHVGVSLCEAEASVAAPLTSKRQSIGCMLTVVAEGRCSLSTSYLIFKYIIVYAFIQVFAVNLMYSYGGSVGNYQYLIQDLLFTTVGTALMGFTRPAKKLSKERPPDRLMSLAVWLPVICQFTTCAVFQVLALAMLGRQPFYTRFDPHPSDGTSCFSVGEANSVQCSHSWENSVTFLMSLGQFLITASVFNKGPPHRKPLYTNTGLMIALTAQTSFLVFLILSPGGSWVTQDFAGLVPFPADFRARLAALLLFNLGASWLVDWLAHLLWRWMKGRRVCGVTLL